MKLWDKGYSTDKKIDLFTVGNDRELDLILAKYDVLGNIAHAKMLHKIGLLSATEIAAYHNLSGLFECLPQWRPCSDLFARRHRPTRQLPLLRRQFQQCWPTPIVSLFFPLILKTTVLGSFADLLPDHTPTTASEGKAAVQTVSLLV